jgi:co-chaperonin GroES (HSP10)
MKLNVLGGRVAVKPEPKPKSSSLIETPETSLEHVTHSGIVLGVGSGEPKPTGGLTQAPEGVKEGARVYYHDGHVIGEIKVDGEVVQFVPFEHLLGWEPVK